MKAKIAFTLGIFSTLLLGTWVYAATNYVSVAQSLMYLRSAWDIGHIGYIITSIFDTNNNKIKQEYLDLTWLSSSWAIETETDPVWLSQKAWYVATSRSISATAPLSGGGNLSTNRTISIAKSTASTDGYLSKEDFTTFSGKAPIASPTFTWVPKAPVPNDGADATQIATVGYVDTKIAQAAWWSGRCPALSDISMSSGNSYANPSAAIAYCASLSPVNTWRLINMEEAACLTGMDVGNLQWVWLLDRAFATSSGHNSVITFYTYVSNKSWWNPYKLWDSAYYINTSYSIWAICVR